MSAKMKILLLHNFYRFRGGEDRYVKILEDLLLEKGHQVVQFFSDSRNITEYSLIRKAIIPFQLIHSSAQRKRLRELIRKEKPDLAIVHNLFPLFSQSLLAVLKESGVPVIKRLENYKFLCLNGLFLRNNFQVCESCKQGNFLHGVLHRCYQQGFFSSLGIALPEYLHRRRKTALTHADHFLATSNFVKSKFTEAGFPAHKISVSPNFLDFEPLAQPGEPGQYAVYLGRLSAEKGLMTMLEGLRQLPDLPVKILGEGPLLDEMKAFVHTHHIDNVSFEGFIDGTLKRDILAGAMFLIFPSECYESFGYTVIESYACGTPVIASDIGGARELVPEGETGYLFTPGDPQDFKRQVLRIMADPHQLMQMRRNALERAGRLYTRTIGYRSLKSLFEQLTGK